MTILPMDEINALGDGLRARFPGGVLRQDDREDILDELLDLFLLAYAEGAESANSSLGTDGRPSTDDAEAAVNAVIAGETWRERVDKYFDDGGSVGDIIRIAETDATRIYNQGAMDAVSASGIPTDGIYKRWNTMQDDRVRDTHFYLENMAVPLDAEFYTDDGDHALAPGMFEKPENNINCRCWITIERG